MSESACGPEDHQTAVTDEASIRVSVILCVNNAQDTVEEQLQALAVQDFDQPWELVVVDNRCSDETIAIVRRQADRIPRLRVVPASARAGLAYARNVGAGAAAGEFLAFCDGDDAVRPQWLRALVETCPDMGMVGGALALDRYNDQTSQFWRGASPTLRGLPTGHAHLAYAVGANFGVHRATFLAVGGCDERFLCASDDVDLSWRIQLAGFPLAFAEAAVADYRLRSTIMSAARQRFAYGRDEVILYVKHRPLMRRQISAWLWTSWYLASRWHHLVRDRNLRGRWVCVWAYHAGRLRGSWEHRVWFP